MAIDRVVRNEEKEAVKQMRLFALHERLRYLSEANASR